MIQNIVFDLGNVLLDFNPKQFLLEKYADKILCERLFCEVFKCPEWAMLDKGVVTQEEVVSLLSQRYPREAREIEEVFQHWTKMLKPISGTVEILPRLKEVAYNIYVLSNFHLQAFEEVYRKNAFFQYFDGIVISAQEKTSKPEEAIYRRLLLKYKLIPETSVFIDDQEENLKAAEKLGIKTILFNHDLTNPGPDLAQRLREYAVSI